MAEKSLLIGDEVAELLIDYAALVARISGGDRVVINAIGSDGDEVEATFLLNSGTVLMVESSRSPLPEPQNADAVKYLRARLRAYQFDPGPGDIDDDANGD